MHSVCCGRCILFAWDAECCSVSERVGRPDSMAHLHLSPAVVAHARLRTPNFSTYAPHSISSIGLEIQCDIIPRIQSETALVAERGMCCMKTGCAASENAVRQDKQPEANCQNNESVAVVISRRWYLGGESQQHTQNMKQTKWCNRCCSARQAYPVSRG